MPVLLLILPLLLLLSCTYNPAKKVVAEPESIQGIKLPPGFRISYFAREVDNARSMTLGDKGTVFVGTRRAGNVYALQDTNNDGVADRKYTILSDLKSPNGVAFRNGSLYVAEISKIWRLDNIEDNLANPPKPVLIYSDLPTDGHHGWKYIAFGPDGKLYVPVGAPCDNCDENKRDPRYASITRMNSDGSGFEVYAHGIRNTVGFAWHPETKELWFTDNGRDNLGDDKPADELNHAPKAGMNFGYPYCHQGDLADPEYGKERTCAEFIAPDVKLGPHVAALGMKFYTGTMFPVEYRNRVFIAEHGSWNRSTPVGYRVTTVSFKDGKAVYEPFAEGWLKDEKAWARPVDILVLKDGSLLVSDDSGDNIFRITYRK